MRHSRITSTQGYTAVDEDELRAGINLLQSTSEAAPED